VLWGTLGETVGGPGGGMCYGGHWVRVKYLVKYKYLETVVKYSIHVLRSPDVIPVEQLREQRPLPSGRTHRASWPPGGGAARRRQ